MDKKNNYWHTHNDSDTVFVFLHGFFSDSLQCWTSANGEHWPDIVATDDRLNKPAIYMAGYYTGIDSGSYKISDCAKEVFDALQLPTASGQRPVLNKSNIVLICHSLGGIVARYMLETNREFFSKKTVGLALMASPSLGSAYADKFSSLIKFYKNGVASQLKAANGSLEDLDDRFKTLLENKWIPRLVGAEAIEHHAPIHYKFLPGFAPVVSKESAARYFGAARMLPNTNHSTCVKPNNSGHSAHEFLVKFYLQKVSPIEMVGPTSNNAPSLTGQLAENALFEAYYPKNELYYFKRNADDKIAGISEQFSIWVHGASGIGKTSAMRRESFSKNRESVQIYIGGTLDPEDGHLGMLREVYYTLTSRFDLALKNPKTSQQLISEISNVVFENLGHKKVQLMIDEVPLLSDHPGEMRKFIKAIGAMLQILKQRRQGENISIVVISIFDPTEFIDAADFRVSENLKFFKMDRWVSADLFELAKVIESSSNTLKIGDDKVRAVIEESDYTPRFLKTFYKNHITKIDDSNQQIGTTIAETKSCLRTAGNEL